MCGTALAPSVIYAEEFCDYKAVAKSLATGQLETAYLQSTDCELKLKQPGPFDESKLRLQYFATAQILTALGKFDQASDRMIRAEPLANSFGNVSDEMESATRNFLLERTGRKLEAMLIYSQKGNSYAKARLAIIQLDQGNESQALDAAQAALTDDPSNKTALVVLGALMQKSNPTQALVVYERIIESFENDLKKYNPSVMPLNYLEIARAYAGRASLKSKP